MMNAASKVFGVICFLFFVALGIGPRNLEFFIDPVSMIFVFGGTFTLLFGSLGLKGVKRFCVHFRSDDPEQQAFVQRTLKFTCLYAMGTGALATILGLVFVLQNLDDPSALGPSMAVAALPNIYGVLTACCILPMVFHFSEATKSSLTSLLVVISVGFFAMPLLNIGIYLLVIYPFIIT